MSTEQTVSILAQEVAHEALRDVAAVHGAGGPAAGFCFRWDDEDMPGIEWAVAQVIEEMLYEEPVDWWQVVDAAVLMAKAREFRSYWAEHGYPPEPPPPPLRKAIPMHTRRVVFARDKGTCRHCGATDNLHIDHIHPVSHGGSNHEDNLQVLCAGCNLRKSDKVPS